MRLKLLLFVLLATGFILKGVSQTVEVENWDSVVKSAETGEIISYSQLWFVSHDSILICTADKNGQFAYFPKLSNSYSEVWITHSDYQRKMLPLSELCNRKQYYLTPHQNKSRTKRYGCKNQKAKGLTSLLTGYRYVVLIQSNRESPKSLQEVSIFTGKSFSEGEDTTEQLPYQLLLLEEGDDMKPSSSFLPKTVIVFP